MASERPSSAHARKGRGEGGRPYAARQTVALALGGTSALARVLGVAHMLSPLDDVSPVVGLLEGDVGHEPVRSGAVPVVLAGLEEDAVAGTDLLDRAAHAPAEPDALGDPDRLAPRMRMPRGSGARREVHDGGADLPIAAR